jgi:maltooligosyltrehalose trehalohydrolase
MLTFEQEKLAAAAVVLSPFTPLLFMGQEYGERAPFPYFVSHSDPELVEAVRTGRKEEFAAFEWGAEPPDPQAEDTFRSAVPDWSLRDRGRHAVLLEVYRTLLALRRENRALTSFDRIEAEDVGGRAIVVRRHGAHGDALLALDFSAEGSSFDAGPGHWRIRFDSAAPEWDGPGDVRPVMVAGSITLRPYSAVLLTR